MGILNITPDSFSDGGQFLEIDAAYQHAQEMIAQGADIIDIGGESSRPGAKPLSAGDELRRVIPVIERIRKDSDVCISIDTYKAEVMEAAIRAGASMINDIKALTEANALVTAAQLNVPICLMHMHGAPETMQDNPHYVNHVTAEVQRFFEERIEACLNAGIPREHLILDPGFGFGKSVLDNLLLVKELHKFQTHNLPILLGASRKSTIGAILKTDVSARLTGGVALAIFAALQGVGIIRTHDVGETNQALTMIDAIVKS